jgi:hypothetical protein
VSAIVVAVLALFAALLVPLLVDLLLLPQPAAPTTSASAIAPQRHAEPIRAACVTSASPFAEQVMHRSHGMTPPMGSAAVR